MAITERCVPGHATKETAKVAAALRHETFSFRGRLAGKLAPSSAKVLTSVEADCSAGPLEPSGSRLMALTFTVSVYDSRFFKRFKAANDMSFY